MAAPESRFVETGEVVLHAVDWGRSGPLLLVLHGGQRTSRSWDAVARSLAADFWVIALDSRGQGESSKPSRGYSQRDRVRDLERFCQALSLPSAAVLGHSGGAATALLASLWNPQGVTRVVAIEPVLRQTPSWGTAMAERAAGTRRVWPSVQELRKTLESHPATRRWRPDVLQDVLDHEVWHLPDGSVEMKWTKDIYNAGDRGQDVYDFVEMAPQIPVPTLLVYGTASGYNPDDARAFAKAAPQGSLLAVEGAGHNVYMEQPDVVAEAVRTFLPRQNMGVRSPRPSALR